MPEGYLLSAAFARHSCWIDSCSGNTLAAAMLRNCWKQTCAARSIHIKCRSHGRSLPRLNSFVASAGESRTTMFGSLPGFWESTPLLRSFYISVRKRCGCMGHARALGFPTVKVELTTNHVNILKPPAMLTHSLWTPVFHRVQKPFHKQCASQQQTCHRRVLMDASCDLKFPTQRHTAAHGTCRFTC